MVATQTSRRYALPLVVGAVPRKPPWIVLPKFIPAGSRLVRVGTSMRPQALEGCNAWGITKLEGDSVSDGVVDVFLPLA